jgi:hypothetical protein
MPRKRGKRNRIHRINEETTLPRKRQKQPPAPRSWNLEQIEEWAVMFGNEVLLGPRKVKIVRVVTEFVPNPEAGPGQWQASHVDEIVEEAVNMAKSHNMTAEMFRALSLASYEAIEQLRESVQGSRASKT